jgi:type IV pilus assembly protein PilW
VPNWTNIHAVSICLQLAGDTQGNPRVGAAFKGCRDQNIANDGKIRRLFRRTFSIRNALL